MPETASMVVTAAAAAASTAHLPEAAIVDGPDECDAAAKGAVGAVPVAVAQAKLSALAVSAYVASPAAAVSAAGECINDLPAAVVAFRIKEPSATGTIVGLFGAAVEASARASVVPGKTVLFLSVTAEVSATAASSAPEAKHISSVIYVQKTQQSSVLASAVPVCTCRTGDSGTAGLSAGEEDGDFPGGACGCSGGKSRSKI